MDSSCCLVTSGEFACCYVLLTIGASGYSSGAGVQIFLAGKTLNKPHTLANKFAIDSVEICFPAASRN